MYAASAELISVAPWVSCTTSAHPLCHSARPAYSRAIVDTEDNGYLEPAAKMTTGKLSGVVNETY